MNDLAVPIVGIGASAGGIEAFHGFFNHMPADSGMAFVMILHLPAEHNSLLTDILSRWTSMRVMQATHGMTLEANGVYVPPPHTLVTLSSGKLSIEAVAQGNERMFRPNRWFLRLVSHRIA